MNQTSKEIVDKITASLVMPSVGMTLTQEEADAIKEHVRVRLEENIQGAVHSGFFRFNMSGYKRPGMINREREAEIRREARKRCLDEIEALSKNESIQFGIGCDVNRVYCFAMQRYSQRESVHNIQNISIVELIGSRITEYSDWCWENLERASVGKELLPRLEWEKTNMSLRAYVDAKYFHHDKKILRDGEPCGHPGCLHHISHPCEGCGRIGGRKVGGNENDKQ